MNDRDSQPGLRPLPGRTARVQAIALALVAALLPAATIGASEPAPPAAAATPAPLQARLDALQRIVVTEARAPTTATAPASPAVQQALNAAAVAESEAPAAPAAQVQDAPR